MCSSPKPQRKFAIDTLNIWVITKIYEKCHQTAHKSVAIPKQCVTKPSISFREKKKEICHAEISGQAGVPTYINSSTSEATLTRKWFINLKRTFNYSLET